MAKKKSSKKTAKKANKWATVPKGPVEVVEQALPILASIISEAFRMAELGVKSEEIRKRIANPNDVLAKVLQNAEAREAAAKEYLG